MKIIAALVITVAAESASDLLWLPSLAAASASMIIVALVVAIAAASASMMIVALKLRMPLLLHQRL